MYFAFDLMFVDGHDLRGLPLVDRKKILEQRWSELNPDPGHLRFSAHVVGEGPAFFRRACELNLEGSIAKRADSHYVSGRPLRTLGALMAKLERPEPPFHDPPRGADLRGVHWLEPRLVAEVEFIERTEEGLVRHGSFQGLRDDKPATLDMRASDSPTRTRCYIQSKA